MLYYALCLSYHSNTEAAVFACLSSGWDTTTGRLLGPKVGTALSVFAKDTATRYRIDEGIESRSSDLTTTPLTYYANSSICDLVL